MNSHKTPVKASQLHNRLETALNDLIAHDYELGAQVAIYLHGELIVNLAVGRTFPDSEQRVTSNTLFPVCSTGKSILATLIHILVEQGHMEYDQTIASYWPEFAAHGKEQITIRHALSHMSSIPSPPNFETLDEICNFDSACARIAQLTPEYPVGSRMEYHARTFSWILGGAVEHATGRSLKDLFLEKITQPLNIERNLFFGTDDEAETRVAPFVAQPIQKEQVTTAPTAKRSESIIDQPIMEFVNKPQVRRACMPAVNGIMSAQAIAKVYASIIGEVDGQRLLPESRLDQALMPQTQAGAVPECFGHSYGLGYTLKGPREDMGALFGHGGAGGSEGMANRRLGLAIGITKNRMDTHENAPTHTNWMVMQTIQAVFGTEGDGGFYH